MWYFRHEGREEVKGTIQVSVLSLPQLAFIYVPERTAAFLPAVQEAVRKTHKSVTTQTAQTCRVLSTGHCQIVICKC